MRPFSRDFLRVIQSHFTDCRIVHHNHSKGHMTSFSPASVALEPKIPIYGRATGTTFLQQPTSHLKGNLFPSIFKSVSFSLAKLGMVYPTVPVRCLTTTGNLEESITVDSSTATTVDVAPRIKFKRLSKTAKHIMQILDKEAVQEVRERREIPDIRPGYIIQLKVEVPENKRRVSMLKGIVIARRNAGLNTTFRLRRMVAGVGVESVFPLCPIKHQTELPQLSHKGGTRATQRIVSEVGQLSWHTALKTKELQKIIPNLVCKIALDEKMSRLFSCLRTHNDHQPTSAAF